MRGIAGQIARLWRYPVKSMLGEPCEHLDLEGRGVAGDRLFAVRDGDGKFGSGKTTRRFRKIDGLLEFAASYEGDIPRVTFPDGRRLRADDPGIHPALSNVLGQPVTLAREANVSHLDAGPVHLLTIASLAWLRAALPGAEVDERRFRPNVVIEAAGDGQIERGWLGATLRIGDAVTLRVREGTERCVMVGLPQAGLPDDPQILKTLGRDADTEFGVYADVLVGGRIARHDAVVVILNAGPVTLRTAGDTDQAFLRDMLYQSLHVPAGHAPFSRDVLSRPEIAKYVEGWGRAGDIGLVAVDLDGREAIGAAWLRLFTGADRGFGYVDDRTPELGIAVVTHRRGEGIGTALLTGLLDAARERYDAVSLSVSADNPAVRLYERLGFARVAGHRGSLTMLKSIGPRP